MEGGQGRGAVVGAGDRNGTAWLAYRVLGDGEEVSGGQLRSARRGRRPDVSAPRERDRAVGVGDGKDVRAALDACALSAG